MSVFDEGWEILRARKRVQRPRNSQRSLLLSVSRLYLSFSTLPVLRHISSLIPLVLSPTFFLFPADTMLRIRGRE